MKTKELKQTIKALTKVVTNKTINELMRVNIDSGYIHATNLEVDVRLALPNNSLGNCSIDFKEFKKAIEMFENIDSIEVTEDKAIFNADGATVKYAHYPERGVMQPQETEYKLSYEIGGDMPKLETALKFVGDDELRTVMMHIAVNNSHIVATNAHYLYFDPTGNQTECNLLIKPLIVKLIKDIGTDGWQVYESDKFLKFTDGRNTLLQKIEDNKFPDWQRILPQSHETMITADKKELMAEVKRAANFNPIKNISLDANGSLKIEASDIDLGKEYSKELKEYSKSGGDIKIGFNAEYLTNILNEVESNTIHFKLVSNSRAAIINDKFLLMPVMLNI